MSKTYKGYELLKAIADKEIKDGAKIEIIGRFLGDLIGSYFIYNEGEYEYNIYTPENKIYEELSVTDILNYQFRIIEDEIDIQEIEEIKECEWMTATDRNIMINKLIKSVKQLDKKLKEKE